MFALLSRIEIAVTIGVLGASALVRDPPTNAFASWEWSARSPEPAYVPSRGGTWSPPTSPSGSQFSQARSAAWAMVQ